MDTQEPCDPLIFRHGADESACRREMIAQAAYFRAKRRHFVPGREREDWLVAEAEVDQLLVGGVASDRR